MEEKGVTERYGSARAGAEVNSLSGSNLAVAFACPLRCLMRTPVSVGFWLVPVVGG